VIAYHTAGEGRLKLVLGYIVNFKLVNGRYAPESGRSSIIAEKGR